MNISHSVSAAGVVTLTGHRQDGSTYPVGTFFQTEHRQGHPEVWVAKQLPSDVYTRHASADAAHTFLLNEATRRNLAEWA